MLFEVFLRALQVTLRLVAKHAAIIHGAWEIMCPNGSRIRTAACTIKTASFNVRHPKRVRKRGGALQKMHRAIRMKRQTPNWRLATFKNQTTNHQAMNTDPTTVEQQRVI